VRCSISLGVGINDRYGFALETKRSGKTFSAMLSFCISRITNLFSGDLHFAYALPEDGLDGRIYKCTTYNPYLDVKAGGSYTQLTVTGSKNVVLHH